MQLDTGSRLGTYEIIGLLGAGGMGEAYRATSPTFAFGRPAEVPRRGRVESNPVTGRRQSDVMPDGRIIGIINTAGRAEATNEILVVLNWFDEVRQRAPRK